MHVHVLFDAYKVKLQRLYSCWVYSRLFRTLNNMYRLNKYGPKKKLTVSAGTVCKRSVFISTLNFPSHENDTNLFIESFTLRDALWLLICIEKYPFIQGKIFVYKFIFVFCVTLEYEKENNEFNLSFWPHPWIISRCIPIRVASRTRHDKNYVQIQKKKKHQQLHLTWVYNKTNCSIPS